MKTETYIQIASLLITFFIALTSSFTKIIDNDRVTKWGFCAIIIMLFSLGLSVFLELVKANKERDKERADKEEYESIINRSDETLNKATLTIERLDKNLVLSSENLRKADIIIDSLAKELQIQQEINATASSLVERQQQQLDDAQRLLNPVYPFHLYIEYYKPFDYPGMEKLVNYLEMARSEYLSNRTFVSTNMGFSTRNDMLYLSNYEESIPDFKEMQPFDKIVSIDFTFEKIFNRNEPFDTQNSFLSLRSMYRKHEFNPSARKKFSRMEADFKNRQIKYKIYFTELEIVTYKNELARAVGLKDLINSYLTISTFSRGKVLRAHLYFGSHFNKYLSYWFLDEETFMKEGIVTRQIKEKDLFPEHSTMDDYQILYYERGTESVNLPFPDLP